MNGQIIIPATFIKVSSYRHNDSGETLLICGINMNSGVAVAECYKVPRNLTGIVKIGSATVAGKDDSVSGIVYNDGTVRMTVSEADTGGSGTTSAVRVYDFINAFPAAALPTSTANDLFIRSIVKQVLTGIRDLANKYIAQIP